jgi:hypothetical protein
VFQFGAILGGFPTRYNCDNIENAKKITFKKKKPTWNLRD